MNVFGIGGMELIFILLIMLVVAGPKRMIQWAYILGQYTAKLRRMWEETVDYIQQEIDDAGVDVKLPKELPTRATINRSIASAMKPITAPVEEALHEVDDVRKMATGKPASSQPRPVNTPPASPEPASEITKPSFGTWSGASTSVNNNNGEQPL